MLYQPSTQPVVLQALNRYSLPLGRLVGLRESATVVALLHTSLALSYLVLYTTQA